MLDNVMLLSPFAYSTCHTRVIDFYPTFSPNRINYYELSALAYEIIRGI